MKKKLEKLRNNIFWTFDGLKGGTIKSHIRDIKNIIDGDDPVFIEQEQSARMQSLLEHAVRSTEYYIEYECFSAIDDFPVVNKSIIRESESSFRSNRFTEKEVIPIVTSGSTGTPFKVYHDLNKKNRNSADTIFFSSLAGFSVGHRLAYMKIWSEANKKSLLQSWLQNVLALDVLKLDDKKIEGFIKELESDRSSFGFLAYASALELICKYLDRNNYGKVAADVQSVIAMSESLNGYTRSAIPKYFGVPVVSRYSNLENGIIAQQGINNSDGYLINTASYLVEILHMDSDQPVPQGQLGRIIVTDYFNYAMPMIRYDTGDIGSMAPERVGNKLYLAHVEGRKLDLLYDTRGNLVSSFIVYKNMWQYTEIIQYQLVQYGAMDYKFKITKDKPFDREQQLISEFKSYLGQDANFTIEYVSEIPLLASGKRKKIVNTFHGKK
jgi:phenylacetate-CoA ligase